MNLRADSEAMLVAIRPSNGEILAVAQTERADEKGDIALQGPVPAGLGIQDHHGFGGCGQTGCDC